jgi:serine/threonine protein kinase
LFGGDANQFNQKTPKNIFALKKLRSERIEDFKREARALRAFAVCPHDHIVRLLAAFRHEGSFFLLFPWATGGSLRSFWRGHPHPTVKTEISTWVAKQSLGIAAALYAIHYQPDEEKEEIHDYGQQGASIEVRGYHGDIKAENILLFDGDPASGARHVWKIGDFGVAKRFLVTARGGDIPKGFTPTYQSPEHLIEGRSKYFSESSSSLVHLNPPEDFQARITSRKFPLLLDHFQITFEMAVAD